jgi:hypothetical protein
MAMAHRKMISATHRYAAATRRGIQSCPRALVAVALVLGLVFLSACGQPHPTLAELEQLPGAHLTYPGSRTDVEGGSDSNNKFGPNPAAYSRVELTDASATEVAAYYDEQLVALGWTKGGNGWKDSRWKDEYSWMRGKRLLQLGIYKEEAIQVMIKRQPEYAKYHTVYGTLLQ